MYLKEQDNMTHTGEKLPDFKEWHKDYVIFVYLIVKIEIYKYNKRKKIFVYCIIVSLATSSLNKINTAQKQL